MKKDTRYRLRTLPFVALALILLHSTSHAGVLLQPTETWQVYQPTLADDPSSNIPNFDDLWKAPGMPNIPGVDFTLLPGIYAYGNVNGIPNATQLNEPPDGDRLATVYFRTTFSVPDNADAANPVNAEFVIDDGAIIWINGERYASPNCNGCGAFGTPSDDVGSEALQTLTGLPPLSPGLHTIAVEVHNVSPTSSDLGFSLFLENNTPPPPPDPLIPISFTGQYDQNFDSIGNTLVTPQGWGVDYNPNPPNQPVTNNRDLAGIGGVFTDVEGPVNTGLDGDMDRSIGSRPTGTPDPFFILDAHFVNDTGSRIDNSIIVSYDVEHWSTGGQETDIITFLFSTDGTNWIALPALSAGPIPATNQTGGPFNIEPLNGNEPENRQTIVGNIDLSQTPLEPGARFFLRWSDEDGPGNGFDKFQAIDNVSLFVDSFPPPPGPDVPDVEFFTLFAETQTGETSYTAGTRNFPGQPSPLEFGFTTTGDGNTFGINPFGEFEISNLNSASASDGATFVTDELFVELSLGGTADITIDLKIFESSVASDFESADFFRIEMEVTERSDGDLLSTSTVEILELLGGENSPLKQFQIDNFINDDGSGEFAKVTHQLNLSPNTVSLRLVITASNDSGSEHFIFDNILIDITPVIPEPTAIAFISLTTLTLIRPRKYA